MKALVMANNEYHCIRTATHGIIFLATPFRGTRPTIRVVSSDYVMLVFNPSVVDSICILCRN
jgi:hypothetical protein